MDELTLNGEKYISSKQAAKITGYTKDYVGQLCREGKIVAQLVGRNWYISEKSIHKHRFDLEDSSTTHKSVVHKVSIIHPQHKKSVDINDHVSRDTIRYTHDDEDLIPLREKEEEAKQIPDTKQEKQIEGQDMISAMQSAWQEWFITTNKKTSDDISEHHSIDIEDVDPEKALSAESYDNNEYTPKHHTTQNVVMSKIPSTKEYNSGELLSKDEEGIEGLYEEGPVSNSSGIVHVINIVLMLIALIFFTVAMLNLFLRADNGINQLNYISGISTYTAK